MRDTTVELMAVLRTSCRTERTGLEKASATSFWVKSAGDAQCRWNRASYSLAESTEWLAATAESTDR